MALGHRQHTGTHSKTNAAWTEKSSVAATTEKRFWLRKLKFQGRSVSLPVDFAIWSVAQVGWVEGTVAVGTVKAAFVPWAVFADHLFGGKNNESTSWAASSISWACASNSSGTEILISQHRWAKYFIFQKLTGSKSILRWLTRLGCDRIRILLVRTSVRSRSGSEFPYRDRHKLTSNPMGDGTRCSWSISCATWCPWQVAAQQRKRHRRNVGNLRPQQPW